MSGSIKLKHASGNGVIIAAPSSNPAADRTLTLPSDADGIIAKTDASGNLTVAGDLTVDTSTLKVDSSNNRVGVGTTSPDRTIHCHNSSNTTNVRTKFSNGTTGEGASDGFEIGINASDPAQAVLVNYENSPMAFFTNATERMRIDGSGQVGMGTSSPVQQAGRGLHINGTDQTRIKLTNASSGATANDGFDIIQENGLDIHLINHENAEMKFGTNAAERVRIDSSGNLLVGTTAADGDGLSIRPRQANATTRVNFNRADTSDNGTALQFLNNFTTVGTIKYTNSATQYNTSSDYRLKENAVAISDGITRLKTLKPYRFNFKVKPDTTVDGFFAHEVTAVPEAISGTKDEVVTQELIDSGEYEKGTLNNPIYQGIDQSKLVPLLTAALQEAITKIETLETKVAVLEAK